MKDWEDDDDVAIHDGKDGDCNDREAEENSGK